MAQRIVDKMTVAVASNMFRVRIRLILQGKIKPKLKLPNIDEV